jgi:putative methyltransferase (TIGR04325 family)
MNPKQLFRLFAPPIAVHLMRRGRGLDMQKVSSWKEAARGQTGSFDSIGTWRVEETLKEKDHPRELRPCDVVMLSALGMALHRVNSPVFRVLDFGGAAGVHFFLAKRMFPGVVFDWRVIEAEGVVKAARDGIHEPELQFFDSLTDQIGQSFDFVVTTDTLHCIEQSLQVVDILTAFKAPALLINRTGISEGDDLFLRFTRQANPPERAQGLRTASFPQFFPSKAKLLARLSPYQEQFSFNDTWGAYYVPGHSLKFIAWFGLLP